MRVPLIAGNWKMNTTVDEAVSLIREMRGELALMRGVEKVVCPPFISLLTVSELIKGSSIKLGAQNMYYEEKGAYTGEISPEMLVGWCHFVILGHSERRQHFGETDELIGRKVRAALKAGLKPILCVGESLEENEAGITEEVVTTQVKAALATVRPYGELVIAYEPLWAIGTGRAASGEQANTTIGVIRRVVSELYGEVIAQSMPILYGGSVTGANVAEFVSGPEVDGALVGGASLKAAEFLSIVRQTASVKSG
jgi:triosephosphate isomerase